MTYTLPLAYVPSPDARLPESWRIDTVQNRDQLTRLRHRAGISQQHLADLLGTTSTTVSRMERGVDPIGKRWSSHLTLLFAHILKQEGEAEQ